MFLFYLFCSHLHGSEALHVGVSLWYRLISCMNSCFSLTLCGQRCCLLFLESLENCVQTQPPLVNFSSDICFLFHFFPPSSSVFMYRSFLLFSHCWTRMQWVGRGRRVSLELTLLGPFGSGIKRHADMPPCGLAAPLTIYPNQVSTPVPVGAALLSLPVEMLIRFQFGPLILCPSFHSHTSLCWAVKSISTAGASILH